MKIFSAAQIKQWDQFTIDNDPISSIDLMERAAQKCTDWLNNFEVDHHPIKIFAGKGNNGGDGLAIARQLAMQGIFCKTYILNDSAKGSDDFEENLHRLYLHTSEVHFIDNAGKLPVIKKDDLVIDALYGIGLNRPLEGLAAATVLHINSSGALIVSIDMPSGMFADQPSNNEAIIQAEYTLTFQVAKLAFLLPENEKYTGELHVLDIELNKHFLLETQNKFELIDHQFAQILYKPRKNFSHKGNYGHSLLIAGSNGKMGAAYLAGNACIRSGVGLLTCLVPKDGVSILQTNLPEAMCLTGNDRTELNWKKYNAVAIGPGLGTDDAALNLLKQVIDNYEHPAVFDADALNLLSVNPDLQALLPKHSIITPHPKEYERLFGASTNSFERLDNALYHAARLNIYIVLKGHHTFIACPDGVGFFNSTGNAGMATGGSGDVLTGILVSLLAQGYSSKNACQLGVYLHGLSGDIAAEALSQESLIASDIVSYLGKAFKQFEINK